MRHCGKLDLKDFDCRFLVVDDIGIPLGDSLRILKVQPIGNAALDGFGNPDPGGGRRGHKRSPWDTRHPGRARAAQQFTGEQSTQALPDDWKTVIAQCGQALA
ncbi:MAG: Eco29kI family restriction endonuclease [Planctomycetaceae bacterium]